MDSKCKATKITDLLQNNSMVHVYSVFDWELPMTLTVKFTV